jgi:hypothetical protein
VVRKMPVNVLKGNVYCTDINYDHEDHPDRLLDYARHHYSPSEITAETQSTPAYRQAGREKQNVRV